MSIPVPPFGLGAHPDLPDPRDLRLDLTGAGPMPAAVDLRALMRPIRNQGQSSACTAYAATRAMEYQRAHQGHANLFDGSKWFTYAGVRKRGGTWPQDNGGSLRNAFQSIAQDGMCPDALWPEGMQRINIDPFAKGDPAADKARFAAAHHTGLTYRAVEPTLAGIRGALAAGFAPAFCFSVFESAYAVGTDGVMAVPDIHNEHLYGGHAVCAVGYQADGWVWCAGSWGDNYGQGGYFKVPPAWWDLGITYGGWVFHFEQG